MNFRSQISLLLVLAVLLTPLHFGVMAMPGTYQAAHSPDTVNTMHTAMEHNHSVATADEGECQSGCIDCVFCHAAVTTISASNINSDTVNYHFFYPNFRANALPVEIKPPRILV